MSSDEPSISCLQGGVFADGANVLQDQPLLDAANMEVVPAVKSPKIVSINILLLDEEERT